MTATATDPLARRRGLVRELSELRTAAAGDEERRRAQDAEIASRVIAAKQELDAAQDARRRFLATADDSGKSLERRTETIRAELLETAPLALRVAVGDLDRLGSGLAPENERRAVREELAAALFDAPDDGEVRVLLARAAARLPGAGIQVPDEVLS